MSEQHVISNLDDALPQFVREVISNSFEGLVTLTEELKVVCLNRVVEQIFGLSRRELVSTCVCQLFSDEDRERFHNELEDFRRDPSAPQHLEFEGTALRSDGSRFLADVRVERLEGPSGEQLMAASIVDLSTRDLRLDQFEKLYRRNREMADLMRTMAERERSKLARELHDGLGQLATSVSIQAKLLEQQSERCGNELLAQVAETLTTFSSDMYRTLKNVVMQLDPDLREPGDFSAAVELLVDSLRLEEQGMHVEIDIAGSVEASLEPEQRLNLFRIVQEGLNNSAKHSRATQLKIILKAGVASEDLRGSLRQLDVKEEYSDRNFATLIVQDNGRGFLIDQANAGYGLRGMRNRCLSMAGVFQFNSRPGGGTVLRGLVPLESGLNSDQQGCRKAV